MTPRDILLAFQAGTLSKHDVRAQLRALHTSSRRYTLSEGQRGLWALQRMAPQTSMYNVPLCYRLGSELDAVLLQRACGLLQQRFPVLTSVFGEENGVPFRTEQPLQTLCFAQEDIAALAADAVLSHLRARASQPFSLAAGPLMRVHLFTRSTAAAVEHVLLITVHHIIFDGASVVPLLTTLFDAYRDLAARRQPQPFLAAAPYAAFVDWEQHMLASEPGAEHLAYWSQQLGGPLPLLDLPTERRRWELGHADTDVTSPRRLAAHTITQRLTPELAGALRALAAAQRLHLPVLFLGLFTLLLQRYSGQDEVIVGMPTIGRPQEEFDHEVGYFVNMLAIRAHPLGHRALTDFLRELQLTVVDGLDHAAYPFPALVRALNMPRHDEHHPVFQVAFVYQNFLRSGGLQEILDRYRDTLAITLVADLYQESVYALALEIFEQDGTFDLSLKYQPELYADATVAAMLGHLVTLAAGVVRQPQGALDTYALLTPAEAASIVGTPTGQPQAGSGPAPQWAEACLHEVFAQQARATPDALAVTLDEHSLTYAELEARSTQLARYLQQQGVQPESLVGLSVEPSLDMIVGLLGILKAGGAYVPLDPSYPRERLAYMVRDSRVSLILTQAAQAEQLAALAPNVRLIVLDREWSVVAQAVRADALPERQWAVQAQHLAYVIYTSGSTGTPKGTLVQHNHVVRLFSCTDPFFRFNSTDVWTLFHSLSFDFSVWEIWGALLYGGRLVLVPPSVSRSPRQLYDLVGRERVTVLNQIPSVFMQLIKVSRAATSQEHHLRYVIFGGEALAMPQLKPWFEQCGESSPRLVNMYGITETTVHVTYHQVRQAETAHDVSNIGQALPDLTLYILDRYGHPCPVGVPGEMYVGGKGVSRGYLHQSALTAERFVANPFEPGTRLYKTGDLARWLPNATGQPGEIEYLGRLDEQVKVRGYRIELREIENQLRRHPVISDSVVIVQERWPQADTQEEHQHLIAYYIPSRPGAVSARQLRIHLQACLPAYMVPAAFVELQTLPRTSSGKINRNALRQRPVVRSGAGAGGPPDSALESQVLAIWQSVLGTDQIGVEDGFFDAGGDSILLIAVADRIREGLGVDLQAATLFKYATVRTLSAHIAATRDTTPSVHALRVPDRPASQDASAPMFPEYYQDSLAIIGISCHFPDAPDHRAFWQNLRAGRAAGRSFSAAELRGFGLAEELIRDPHFVPLQLSIADKDCFDPAFFNISRRDAALLDPQARLLLLHAWKAIEDAGYTPDQVPETAVFVSASNTFYQAYQAAWRAPGGSEGLQNSEEYVAWMFAQGGIIPTMISHKLGLQGPSLFVHSNCSSSLVGLHAAWQSLKLHEAELALVGAAMVFPSSRLGYLHRDDLNFSSDGRCKPFDAAADGMVGGEGVAVVLLKRAVDALRDRDHIYALLRGISVNNDGADKIGFYAPSINGQASVIRKVLESTGIDPASIGYVEAHGTGTRLGDPIEVSALSEVYQRYTDKKQFCGIGSVKSNIGHMDTAAGLAGCIKVALSLYHGEIPPSIHYEQPNPAIAFANSPFYVVDRLSPWAAATPHRAALSSFGIGGTNVHAILEQGPASAEPRRASPASESLAVLVPVAAKNDDRLRAYASELCTFLASPAGESVALADLAYTFQVARKPMPARVVFLARTRHELLRQLQAFVDGEPRFEGCFCSEGSGESGSEALQLGEDGDNREGMLRKWWGEKALDKLARLWVQGSHIDWALLYEDQPRSSQPRRLSLPTYPFAKERYGWPANHDAAPAATGTMATADPGREATSEQRFTGSPSRTLWLHPVWEPVAAEARRGPTWPSASDCLLIVGGNDQIRRAVLQHFPAARVCHIGAQDTVHDIVARLQAVAPEPVDHLLWLSLRATDHVSGEIMVEQLEQGILPCFRTIKALLQLGYGSRDLGWTVITAGARAVHQSESVDPHQAALHGLVGAMAQEHRHWKMRLVDIGSGTPAILPPLADLFSLPPDPRGAAWVCRSSAAGAALQWYRQQSIPLVPPVGAETAATPYRAGGVYVVIGGAGTIGRAWSEHVIRSVGARVIWIGRRQPDATIQKALAALAALGSPPLYISADASKRQDLLRALQHIKQQGLTVNGVVHSAVTMLSGTLAEVDEERFRAGLRAKVDISLHLAHLFQNEPLDFMLFFSSIVSFTTHARQSSYAAGCLFQDALAQQLAQQWPGRVKSINWGYWGSSGSLTASPASLSQMAREGIAPIAPPEAMLALDALLSGPLQRIALVKTTNASGLEGLDVNHAERIVMSPGTVFSGMAAMRRLMAMPKMTADGHTGLPFELLQSEWGLRTAEMDDLLCTLLLAQLQSMGLLTLHAPGARTTVADLQARLPQLYGRWIEETVAFLVDHQFLAYETVGGTVLAGPRAAAGHLEIAAAWQQWEQRKKGWLQDPYKAALVVLVETTLRALPAILSGKQLATDILYPNSSMALVEATRQHNRVADYFNDVLASAVVAYVRDRRQRGEVHGRALRLLEIGAGIGGSSRVIFQQLRAAGLQSSLQEYCYSDISRAFLMHGEQQYGAENPFLTYRILNIEESLASQGFDEGIYDLVVAANVLHATRNIRRTLQHAKAALKRGGLLLMNEISTRSLYSHLTFGLLKGWWLYEDEALRMQGSPALSPETWQVVLHEVGFRAVFFPVQESHGLGLQIIIAESDGLVRQRVGAGEIAAVASPAPEVVPARSADKASVPTPSGPAPASYVAAVIAERLAAALKMRRQEIEPHVPFADYGLDSILAVDLVDAINHTLAINLKTTSVFDHSAVSRLTAHIVAEYGERFQEPVVVQAHAVTDRASGPEPLAAPVVLAQTTTTPPLPHQPLDAVAVIGLAGQCPDAGDMDTFWRNLVAGHDAVREFLPAGAAATHTAQWAGIVAERDCFDPLFFNIAPREALSMSLHQRLVLQESWKALEDAGYNPRDLAETQVGMFIGAEPAEYFHETFTGASDAIVASRLSYFLNLNGPALVVNTACSSSATAIHLACESLRNGESSMALAGGVAAPMDYATLLRLREVGMLSPRGRCSPFDAAGDGTVLSEGVGIVVLKRLREAVADGDHIYGVILASGVNQDGASNGITAPNGQAQERLVSSVYRRYGINPEDITYIEAHGTGTKLGDPVEANALVRAFKQFTDKQHYCAIGSAKAHIGHTTAAAGVIGLLKILLSFRHRCIPGLLHFRQLNPHIDFANTPFYINPAALEWQAEKPRTAALNSFGHSGTNAHLVVQEYPQAAPTPGHSGPYLIPLSAKNEERLRDYAGKLLAFVTSNRGVVPDVAAIAGTLQTGREAMDERLLFLVRHSDELTAELKAFLHGQQRAGHCWRGHAKQGKDLVSLFSADTEINGLFSQWVVDGKVHKIAELWARGLPVDWASLYGPDRPFGLRPNRLSLPTYPFAKERYWKPDTKAAPLLAPSGGANGATVALDVLHPLLHRNTSNLAELCFSSTFTGREFFLNDHRVRGRRVLPGVAYLEMAREAVRQALAGLAGFEGGAPTIRLQDVVWIRPIRVAESADGQPLPLRVDIRLRPEERQDGLRLAYEIIVVSPDGESTVHGQGFAIPGHAAAQTAVPVLDLEDLHRQCSQRLFTPEQCYAVYEEAGISYGPGHRGLVKVLAGVLHEEPRVLAEVCVPPTVANERFVLHPGLMDAALQAIAGFFIGSDALMQPALPFALESLEIFGPCAPTMWVLIRPTEGGSRGLLQDSKALRKMDIDLCDASGTVAVRMQGFTARVLGEEGPTGGPAASPPGTGLTLTPVWDVVTATQQEQWCGPAFPVAGERVLIAAGDDTWGAAVARAIRTQVPDALHLGTASTIDAMAETLASPGAIDHLFWIAPAAGAANVDVDKMVDGQEQTVLQLFRAIKALLRLGYGYRPLGLTLVTTRAVSVHGAAVLNPLHAAMHGLVGALAGEYPHWRVRCIDLDNGTTLPPAAEWCTLPPHPRADVWAWRNRHAGTWYRQRLLPVDLPNANHTRYRAGGVYVVIGGAGGIGEAWSEYMIRTYGARIVWVNRRPKDEAIQARLDRLAALGPAPLYIAADASDRLALQRAYEQIKQQHAVIHGLVHAAIVLLDKSLANMDEERFRAGLAAKVDVCVRMAQVFRDEPLDFVLFFSSMTAFLKSPGQSNYAAGCTFKDAFARARAWPQSTVKVVNWGYWGSLGIAASQERQERLATVGLASIEPPEAMAVLEALLAAPLDQVALVKTVPDAAFLAIAGVDQNERLAVYSGDQLCHIARPLSQNPLTPALSPNGGEGASRTAWPWVEQRVLDRVVAVLLRTVSELLKVGSADLDVHADLHEYGLDLVSLAVLVERLNREYKLDEVARHTGARLLTPSLPLECQDGQSPTLYGLAQFLAAEYAAVFAFPGIGDSRAHEELNALLRRLLHAQLTALGLPLAGERPVRLPAFYDRWFEASKGYITGLGRDTTDPWVAWEQKKIAWLADPAMQAMVALLDTALRALPDILSGKRSATDVLFPDASLALVENLYKRNPSAAYMNEVVAATVVAAIRQRQGDAPLRILEIGAGTGGTSAVVLERLEPYGEAVAEYCYTDISRAFLLHAERTYGRRFPALSYRIFDVTVPLAAQGIEAGGYDIVIAANVLHATKNVHQALRNAKATMKRGGVLLLNELSGTSLSTHLTFGLLAGWWLYEDAELRLAGTPALAPATWQAVLEEEGFTMISFPAPEAHATGLQIVVAYSDGMVRQERAADVEVAVRQLPAPAPDARTAPQQETKPQATPPLAASLWREKCTAYVTNLVGKTLGIPAHKLDTTAPMEEYGLDSILVVQLTNAFREVLDGITSTLFFEVQTIDALIDYLLATQPEALRRLLAPESDKRQGMTCGAETVVLQAEKPLAVPVARRFHTVPQPRPGTQGHAVFQDSPLPGQGEGEDAGAPGTVLPQVCAAPTAALEPGHHVVDIAVIGLAGRYPLAADVHEFWDNLRSGRHCIGEIPGERWDWRDFFDEEKGKTGKSYSKWGGFITDIDKFDPLFFHISPQEAEMMDPQERLFLEQAYACIEDAGYTPTSLGASADPNASSSRKVGVFVGVMNSHYNGLASFYSIANRVSYVCDFHGPSMAVDTACSASLTAIHLALESLYSGSSDCALAGGVNLIMDANHYLGLAAHEMLSASDACKSFGARADGFVDGEGVGVVLLKPLSRAIADHDHIYGVIKGSMVNAGGKTNGYTVPNPSAQAQLIAAALQRARLEARTISYVEAHGTGTVLGDPIEIRGLTLAFAQATSTADSDTQFCALGSVKSNIGHAESAAGIAGVTKVLLQMQHRQLVPSLHAQVLNPNIDFASTPFVVQQELAPWPRPVQAGREVPRRAGVSSFGAGGANAHVVLEEYVSTRPLATVEGPFIILLSARNEARLRERVQRLLTAIRPVAPGALAEPDLAAIAYTLQVGRQAMEERLALIVHSLEELTHKLEAFLVTGDDAGRLDNLFRGQVKHGKNALGAFIATADEDLQQAIDSWIAKRQYSQLLALWVNGLAFDWRRLYREGERPYRISLPTYPFARESYWRQRAGHQADHPAIATALTPSVLPDSAPVSEEPVQAWDGLSYLPTWEAQPLSSLALQTSNHRTVLLVYPTASCQLASTIAGFYDRQESNGTVIHLRLDDHTERVAPHTWHCDRHDANSIATCLRDYDRIDGFYFIATTSGDDLRHPDSLRHSLLTHEIQLLRLVKFLKHHDLIANQVDGYVLTIDNYRVDGSAANPSAAGLTGLAYAIAQADYRFRVRNLDLSHEDLTAAHLMDQIATEPASDRGEVVKFYAGRRYKQALLKLDWGRPGASTKIPWRQGGVYVIVGGSGTIGTAVTRYLLRTQQAKMIWIGRRPATDPALRDTIEALRAWGEPPVYIQADVTDATALQQAYDRIKQDYAVVHGAIFAGLVFYADNSVYKTSEPEFRHVLEVKTIGSLNFYNVFRDEPLDFMCFFSSGQAFAFSGAANLSAYAAGITFSDAFVRSIRQQARFPVGTINWGFWQFLPLLPQSPREPLFLGKNIGSLQDEEGTACFDHFIRCLRSGFLHQALCLRASDAVRELMPVVDDELVSCGAQQSAPPVEALWQHVQRDTAGPFGGRFSGTYVTANALLSAPRQEG